MINEKRRYRRASLAVLVLAIGGFPTVGTVAAQVTPLGRPDSSPMVPATETPGGAEFGFALTLTNSGFGVGGYMRDSLNTRWALLVETSVGPGKDEREVAFFNRFGQKSVPGKAHYLLVIPAHFGVQRRIFREQIEDNFRPFLQASAGPTIAWEYPYFSDCNGNGLFEAQADCNNDGVQDTGEGDKRLGAYRALPDGRPLIGFGGGIAVGSYFGHGHRGARGFRIGYSFNYYLVGTSLLEVDIDQPRHYFGTPHVVVFFGRLF